MNRREFLAVAALASAGGALRVRAAEARTAKTLPELVERWNGFPPGEKSRRKATVRLEVAAAGRCPVALPPELAGRKVLQLGPGGIVPGFDDPGSSRTMTRHLDARWYFHRQSSTLSPRSLQEGTTPLTARDAKLRWTQTGFRRTGSTICLSLARSACGVRRTSTTIHGTTGLGCRRGSGRRGTGDLDIREVPWSWVCGRLDRQERSAIRQDIPRRAVRRRGQMTNRPLRPICVQDD